MEIKVGDKVEVNSLGSMYDMEVGVVKRKSELSYGILVSFNNLGIGHSWFNAHELKVIS